MVIHTCWPTVRGSRITWSRTGSPSTSSTGYWCECPRVIYRKAQRRKVNVLRKISCHTKLALRVFIMLKPTTQTERISPRFFFTFKFTLAQEVIQLVRNSECPRQLLFPHSTSPFQQTIGYMLEAGCWLSGVGSGLTMTSSMTM